MIFQPGVQSLHDWPTSFLPHASSMLGRMTPDLRLNRIQRADACQYLGSERRLGEDVEVVEATAHMRPAKGQTHRGVGAISG